MGLFECILFDLHVVGRGWQERREASNVTVGAMHTYLELKFNSWRATLILAVQEPNNDMRFRALLARRG